MPSSRPIEYAQHGVPVDPDTAQAIANAGPTLAQHPASARSFLPNGAPPPPGSLLHQPDLAETLRQIAQGGADAFYKGPFADGPRAGIRPRRRRLLPPRPCDL